MRATEERESMTKELRSVRGGRADQTKQSVRGDDARVRARVDCQGELPSGMRSRVNLIDAADAKTMRGV